MANTAIKFYSKALGASEALALSKNTQGSIVFDKTSKAIYVNGVKYGGSNVADATFSSNVLTISRVSGGDIQLNFSSLATTTSVMAVFNQIKGYLTMDDGAGEYVSSGDSNYVESSTLTNVNTTNVIDTTGSDADMVDEAVAKVDKKAKAILGEVIAAKKEIDAIETGAGLGTNGAYTADNTTNYLKQATSLTDADKKLDTALKSLSDRVDSLNSDAVLDIDINGTSIVDASDGQAHIEVDGTYDSEDNKIATESTVTGAINALDTQADVHSVVYTAASGSNGAKLVFKGVSETDGIVAQGSGSSELQLTKVATTGAAVDVTIADSGDIITATTVEGALAEIAGEINGMDLTATALMTKSDDTTNGNTTFTISGIQEADGKVTLASGNNTSFKTDGVYSETSGSENLIATKSTVTTAINDLDVSNISGFGAGKTLATLTETDGKIAATFQNISITSSQISDITSDYSETGTVAITGTGVKNALQTLDGSHNVVTLGAYTSGTDEHAAYKIDFFDATETDGVVSTNGMASETVYLTAQPTATNPIVTLSDISGLTGAMHYKGVVEADPTISAPTGTYRAGDVVTNGNVEYVYDGTNWRIFGDEGSYALKTTTVTGTNGLTGGGALSSNQTISHATQTTGATTGTAVTSGSVNVVTGITTDTYAHVTSVEKTSVTLPTVNNATLTLAGATSGPISVAGSKEGGAATFTANDSTANIITITHASAPTGLTPSAIKVAVDSYGHVQAGGAIVASEIGITDSDENFTATNVETALAELKTSITNASITIDGHKGAITTGDGLTDVAADGGSFAVKISSTDANGLSVGANGISMAKATGSTFGTVEVTSGNGLSLTNGVVSYAHNTSAITVASKDTDTNVITINGTLTPDTSDAITTSNAITFSAVAATGAATNMTVTSGNYGSSTATTNLQTALNNLSSATVVSDSSETVVVNDSNTTTIATVGGHDISTKVAFYWEEYA